MALIDKDGNEYGSTYDVEDARLESDLLEPINPNSTAKGFIAYDLPEDVGVKSAHIEVPGDYLDESAKITTH